MICKVIFIRQFLTTEIQYTKYVLVTVKIILVQDEIRRLIDNTVANFQMHFYQTKHNL